MYMYDRGQKYLTAEPKGYHFLDKKLKRESLSSRFGVAPNATPIANLV